MHRFVKLQEIISQMKNLEHLGQARSMDPGSLLVTGHLILLDEFITLEELCEAARKDGYTVVRDVSSLHQKHLEMSKTAVVQVRGVHWLIPLGALTRVIGCVNEA